MVKIKRLRLGDFSCFMNNKFRLINKIENIVQYGTITHLIQYDIIVNNEIQALAFYDHKIYSIKIVLIYYYVYLNYIP